MKANLINEGSECKEKGSYLKIERNGVQTRVQQDLDEHEYNQLWLQIDTVELVMVVVVVGGGCV